MPKEKAARGRPKKIHRQAIVDFKRGPTNKTNKAVKIIDKKFFHSTPIQSERLNSKQNWSHYKFCSTQ